MRAIGIPMNMFTVMFAIGRMPGWIAQWRSSTSDPERQIARPRQIYTGPTASGLRADGPPLTGVAPHRFDNTGRAGARAPGAAASVRGVNRRRRGLPPPPAARSASQSAAQRQAARAASRAPASGKRSAGSFARQPQDDALQVVGDRGVEPRGRHHRVAGMGGDRPEPASAPRTAAGRSAGSRPPPPGRRVAAPSGSPAPAACSGDMYSGVPVIGASAAQRGAASGSRRGWTRPKSSSLATSSGRRRARGEDVRRLDVAVDQARRRGPRPAPRRPAAAGRRPGPAAAGRAARPAPPGSGRAGTP